ncbi:hypothetical protein [Thalassotalea atypica]|uniref:hypothetical protein n=1 Tax=Thalassotalea atypica TaxID=2054316 RepID=UPI00257471A3|nr:hypothetical protein [Thalassotalea atypica]
MKLLLNLAFMLILGCLSLTANAITIAELQQQNRLAIDAWVIPDANLAVKQQARLIIEVSTVHWFAGGTRIAHIDIDNAIALHRDKLASNSSERRNGVSWAVQQWELTIYPQKSGDFVIPPLPVQVTVAATPKDKVSGTLITPAIKFSAKLPSPYLSEDSLWVAGSALDVQQQWNGKAAHLPISNEQNEGKEESYEEPIIEIEMGDAITRKITINAEDSTSVMLPNVFENKTNHSLDKAQLYLSPSQLNDSHSRGEYYASRVEEATWMVQKAGVIELPEIKLQWWDTTSNQLQEIVLQGQTFSVIHTPKTWLKAYGLTLLSSLIALIVLIFLLIRVFRHIKTLPTPNLIGLINATLKQNRSLANLYLYRRLFIFQKKLTLRSYYDALPSNSSAKKQWQSHHQQWQQQFSAEPQRHNTSLLLKLGCAVRKKASGIAFRLPKALPELEKINESGSVNTDTNDDKIMRKENNQA